MLTRFIRISAVLLNIAMAPIGTAMAADEWVVGQARGTVFSLVGQKWQELDKGERLGGAQVIRTLQTGRLQLDSPAGQVLLGPNTAIELRHLAITQFSGSLVVDTARGQVMTVSANALIATVNGKATLSIKGAEVSVIVAEGTVNLSDPTQRRAATLDAGESIRVNGSGTDASTPGGNVGSDVSKPGHSSTANPNAGAGNSSPASSGNAAANSNAGGNSATSNAGGNGNAGGNSANSNAGGNSANSNAGGSGNGNAGGNSENSNSGGNGNAGGNGNGNAGGNSDAGGNGNSNAGGNGNSNAGGNGNGNAGGNGNGN